MTHDTIAIIAGVLGCKPAQVQSQDRLSEITNWLQFLEIVIELEDATGRDISREDEERLRAGTVAELMAWVDR